MSVRRQRTPARQGFSLIEATVGLALITAILLSGMTLLVIQPRLTDRARASEEAMRAIEAALETVRAQQLPLESGQLLPGVTYPTTNPNRDMRLTLDVQPTATPQLLQLEIVATYLTSGRPGTRRLTTLAWRP